jgi:hypothetical protein
MNLFKQNPLNESLAAGVRRVGFRKWYERELLSSHAHMLLCFLAAIGLIASFEAMRGATTNEKLLDLLFIVACAAIGLWSLRRYLYLLMHAEEIANQANCPSCKSYGRFTVAQEDRRNNRLRVCCKKCQREWDIAD